MSFSSCSSTYANEDANGISVASTLISGSDAAYVSMIDSEERGELERDLNGRID